MLIVIASAIKNTRNLSRNVAVIQKSMASWVRINVPSETLELRETPINCNVLSDYRNVLVAAGKPSWYSKNHYTKHRSQNL